MDQNDYGNVAQPLSSQCKRLKAFAIGGVPGVCAAICHSATGNRLSLEPRETVEELSPADLAAGDAFFVSTEDDAIGTLKDRLAKAQSSAPIIAIALEARADAVIRALDAGACLLVEGPFTTGRLVDAIEAACRKGRFAGAWTRRALAATVRLKCLSRREREVLEAVAEGLSSKLTASNLSISRRTVETHRASAFAKLGVAHTAQAVRIVLEANAYAGMLKLGAKRSSGEQADRPRLGPRA